MKFHKFCFHYMCSQDAQTSRQTTEQAASSSGIERPPQPKPQKWIRRDTPKVKAEKFMWKDPVARPKFLTDNLNPIDFLELFLDDDIIDELCDNSATYARENDRAFDISREEFRGFLGALWLTGYAGPPRKRLIWSIDQDVRVPMIAENISRNRFDDVLKNVHISSVIRDNNPDDKFHKVRLLISHMNEKSLMFFVPQQNLSVDESMIPYYGKHGCKQFIKGKPIRYGFKFWCLTTSEGYMVQFEPYQGAGTGRKVEGLGMGGSVVVDLMSELPPDLPFHVTCDNLFTSVKLIEYMTWWGKGITGTMRKNRVEQCPLTKTGFDKKPRGTFEFFHDKNNSATICQWNDNSQVIVGTNASSVHPIHTAKRWSAAAHEQIIVDQPCMIKHYNMTMGGVDRMDQNIANYRIGIRIRKWWWPVFAFLLDVAVHQAWQLYRKSEQPAMDLLEFRRYIVKGYLTKCGAVRQRVGRPLAVKGLQRMKEDKRVLPAIRYDRVDHHVGMSQTQLRCGFCHKKTRRLCTKCNRGLHEWCFAAYHKK